VAEDRTAQSLVGYFRSLTDEQRKGVEAVAMECGLSLMLYHAWLSGMACHG
jgi:hypothetical protein